MKTTSRSCFSAALLFAGLSPLLTLAAPPDEASKTSSQTKPAEGKPAEEKALPDKSADKKPVEIRSGELSLEKVPSQPDSTVPKADVARLSVDQENAFAFRLAQAIAEDTKASELGNAVLCPGGISRLLLAVQAGAKGDGAKEVNRALGIGNGNGKSSAPASDANSASSAPPSNVYHTASAVWCDPTFPFLPGYQKDVTESLSAHVADVPLVKDPQAAGKTINSWAEENTGGKVKELLNARELKGAKLVLTDAAWFKDSWKNAFSADHTKPDEFTLPGGAKRQVLYVQATRSASYGHLESENGGADVLALPFATAPYECLCILPALKTKESPAAALRRFEMNLSPKALTALVDTLKPQRVDIQLPKLDLHDLATPMVEALKNMGVEIIFTDACNLSRMTAEGAHLKVSVFKQCSAFRLDESGAEAAAATGVVMVSKSAVMPKPTPTFHANRPCLFLIRDSESGKVAFLVRCAAPAAAPAQSAEAKTDAKPAGDESRPQAASPPPAKPEDKKAEKVEEKKVEEPKEK